MCAGLIAHRDIAPGKATMHRPESFNMLFDFEQVSILPPAATSHIVDACRWAAIYRHVEQR